MRPLLIIVDDPIQPALAEALRRQGHEFVSSAGLPGSVAQGPFHKEDLLERLESVLKGHKRGAPLMVLDSMAALKPKMAPPPSRWRFILCLVAVARGAQKS